MKLQYENKVEATLFWPYEVDAYKVVPNLNTQLLFF